MGDHGEHFVQPRPAGGLHVLSEQGEAVEEATQGAGEKE